MNGVLLMAYGAAPSLDEIPAYLQDIRHGRPPEPALVEEVRARYQLMGGKSPLLDITRTQAKALQGLLGLGWQVEVGMRHSPPWIADAAEKLSKDCETLIGLPLTPFASKMSTGAYFAKLEEAVQTRGLPVRLARTASFHDHPKLIDALADRTAAALERFGGEVPVVLFTAHSLPARIEKEGEPYPLQLKETAALVAKRLELEGFEFAYQSRGRTNDEWLGPDAGEVIDRLALEGRRAVCISPIGFVSEHMETLYDDDVLYRERALRLGLKFERAAALNDHPAFIQALADACQAAVREAPASS